MKNQEFYTVMVFFIALVVMVLFLPSCSSKQRAEYFECEAVQPIPACQWNQSCLTGPLTEVAKRSIK